MERILKYFLINVCADLFSGDFNQRAQQFVALASDDQVKATNIIIAYVKKLRERTALDKSDQYYMNPASLPNKIKPFQAPTLNPPELDANIIKSVSMVVQYSNSLLISSLV